MEALAPVIVSILVSMGVVAEVVIVRVEVNLGVPDRGLKLPVVPSGNPDTDKDTGSGGPRGVTTTVKEIDFP